MSNKLPDYYNEPKYDYRLYWEGRQYEDNSEKLAINKLLTLVTKKNTIGDLGGGFGRLAPLYSRLFEKCFLVDPSDQMLNQAKQYCKNINNIAFKKGSLEKVPIPDNSLDVVLIVRTLHHLPTLESSIKEIARVLKSGGFLIMEFPNKMHYKNILKNIIRGHIKFFNKQPENIATNHKVPFYNFHPSHIEKILASHSLHELKKLSVSNFRSPFLKKTLPLSLLLFIENISQSIFAPLKLGPSVFILAQKTS